MTKSFLNGRDIFKTVDMRIHLFAVVPLILVGVALAIVILTPSGGVLTYLVIGLAAAAALVTIATLFQYTRTSTEAKQVPVENFSIWVDVGEPAADLKRLSFDDAGSAVRIATADLDALASNAELLSYRLSLLVEREGFEEIRQEKLHKVTGDVAHGIHSVIEKLRSANTIPPEAITSLEQYASQSDRIANKLFEFEQGKSEVVHVYVGPLRRAAEKLSRDLRLASANISNFARGLPKATAP